MQFTQNFSPGGPVWYQIFPVEPWVTKGTCISRYRASRLRSPLPLPPRFVSDPSTKGSSRTVVQYRPVAAKPRKEYRKMSRNAWDLIKSKVWGSKEVIPNEVITVSSEAQHEIAGIGWNWCILKPSAFLDTCGTTTLRLHIASHVTGFQRCWRYSIFISTSFFITFPETNSSHLKHWGWEMSFLFWASAYRCELLVFGGAYSKPSQHPKNLIRGTVCAANGWALHMMYFIIYLNFFVYLSLSLFIYVWISMSIHVYIHILSSCEFPGTFVAQKDSLHVRKV